MYPTSARIVDKIHTLRGEYFRHTTSLNERRSFQAKTYNSPTLPNNLLADSTYSESPEPPPSLSPREALFVSKRTNRPKPDPPPEPWSPAELLSFILPASANDVPQLSLLCLQILIKSYSLSDDVLPFIPTHLRRDLMRWAATHHPLTNPELDALCGSDGHVGGELIIVGPNASVREDQFEPLQPSEEWEEEEDRTEALMHTLIVASVHLSPSIHLPATLTRLGLVNILTPVNILNRLPMTCPLLEHLDLSFNVWLVAEQEARERLGKIPWFRWHHLLQLGVRKCYFAPDMIEQVNRGRWDDVTIVN